MNREQAIALVRDSRLASHADAIVASMQDSVRLYREPVDIADTPIGASRFGGPPDLPAGMAWPSWEVEVRRGVFRRVVEEDENRLDCLAQIDLAELPDPVPEECPRQGMLYFFYDSYEQPWDVPPGERSGARVIYAGSPGELLRTPPPPERGEHTPHPCRIRMEPQVTLPEETSLFRDRADYEYYVENLARPINNGDVVHRMFGHPQPIQEEQGIWGRGRQLLLLQLDTDDARDASPGWMWGDAGRLYFTISRSALARRTFDRVRMTLQCY